MAALLQAKQIKKEVANQVIDKMLIKAFKEELIDSLCTNIKRIYERLKSIVMKKDFIEFTDLEGNVFSIKRMDLEEALIKRGKTKKKLKK